MVIIEKFLGKRLEIPEDRRYYIKQGLWAKQDEGVIVFGLSEPALILAGGLKDLGTGGALAMGIIDGAARISRDMLTFEEAGVTDKES